MAVRDDTYTAVQAHGRSQTHCAGKCLSHASRENPAAMADGDKLIAIILHVSELKQEIEDQLIVRKDETGSRVQWQIS